MAPHSQGPTHVPLRTVTDLLSSTPAGSLPNIVQHLVAGLQASRSVLSLSGSSKASKDGSVELVTLHKYKTQLSSLLLGKSAEGRWVAVVLIKTTVDAGGWEILEGCAAWVRGLLGILGKHNPPETKSLCILTLTRIFLLTRGYPTLVREITTPAIPNFITSCLNLISSPPSPGSGHRHVLTSPICTDEVLGAFCHLLPSHPTIFRPFVTQLQTLLVGTIAPTPSAAFHQGKGSITSGSHLLSEETLTTARILYTSLHHCAPKNTSATEWASSLTGVIQNLHATADQAFRAVIEDWETISGQRTQPPDVRSLAEDVTGTGIGPMSALPRWTGIQVGIERLVGLLRLLQQFLIAPTASSVTLPMGALVDTLTRFLCLTVPTGPQAGMRLNPQIGRAERDGLWLGLPQIHVATLEVLEAMVERCKRNFVPVAQGFLGQIRWVFEAEEWNGDIRNHTYRLLSLVLPLIGLSLSKSSVSSLDKIIRRTYEDLLPSSSSVPITDSNSSTKLNSAAIKKSGTALATPNADNFTSQTTSTSSLTTSTPPALQSAAHALLPILITHLPTQHLKSTIRAQLDRTAILTQHKQAMLAAVLNMPQRGSGRKAVSSITPHLARAYGGDLEVEGLLRPRMPVLRSGSKDEEDEEDIDEVGVSAEAAEREGMDLDSERMEKYQELYAPTELEAGGRRKRALDTESQSDPRMQPLESDITTGTADTKRSKRSHETVVADTAVTAETPATTITIFPSSSAQPSYASTSTQEAMPALRTPRETSPRTEAAPLPTAARATTQRSVAASAAHPTAKGDDASYESPKNEDSSDDDDFEIPTLNADPDTDSDEAGDEGAEKEGGYRDEDAEMG